MLRKLRAWLAGSEIAAMQDDIEKMNDLLQNSAHKVEGLALRLERLANRVNMRMNRAKLPRDDQDAELLEQMRPERTQPEFNDW